MCRCADEGDREKGAEIDRKLHDRINEIADNFRSNPCFENLLTTKAGLSEGP